MRWIDSGLEKGCWMLKGCFKCGTDTMKLRQRSGIWLYTIKWRMCPPLSANGIWVRLDVRVMTVASSLFKPNSPSLIIQPQIKPAINGQTRPRDVLGSEFRAKFNLKQMERPHWIERRWGKLPTRRSSCRWTNQERGGNAQTHPGSVPCAA
jgi:hypothetical protein